MLQPKRTKYRKQMKGRNRGLALRGNKVSFGEYGLKATTRGRLTSRQIGAARGIQPRRPQPPGTNHVRGPDALTGTDDEGERLSGDGRTGAPEGNGRHAARAVQSAHAEGDRAIVEYGESNQSGAQHRAPAHGDETEVRIKAGANRQNPHVRPRAA